MYMKSLDILYNESELPKRSAKRKQSKIHTIQYKQDTVFQEKMH